MWLQAMTISTVISKVSKSIFDEQLQQKDISATELADIIFTAFKDKAGLIRSLLTQPGSVSMGSALMPTQIEL